MKKEKDESHTCSSSQGHTLQDYYIKAIITHNGTNQDFSLFIQIKTRDAVYTKGDTEWPQASRYNKLTLWIRAQTTRAQRSCRVFDSQLQDAGSILFLASFYF